MGTIDSHHLGKIMDKNTIKKLTYLSKLSIPESDIDELSKNLVYSLQRFILMVLTYLAVKSITTHSHVTKPRVVSFCDSL